MSHDHEHGPSTAACATAPAGGCGDAQATVVPVREIDEIVARIGRSLEALGVDGHHARQLGCTLAARHLDAIEQPFAFQHVLPIDLQAGKPVDRAAQRSRKDPRPNRQRCRSAEKWNFACVSGLARHRYTVGRDDDEFPRPDTL